MLRIGCCKAKTSDQIPKEINLADNKNEEEDDSSESNVNINRKLFNQTSFTKSYPSSEFIGFSVFLMIKTFLFKHFTPSRGCVKTILYKRIPSIKWIKSYQREYFMPDLLAGITVGIMHIPQGMGYALLATVSPIYGLYTSFYPVVIYWIFGTSNQLSIGTFAVISLMVGSTLTDLESKYVPPVGFNASADTIKSDSVKNYLSLDRNQARVMIFMANTFWVGVVQFMMGFFRLGFVTAYLSEPLVNSFLAGCAVHVFTSQIKFVFGLHNLTAYTGPFKIPKTYIQIFKKLIETNLTAMIISIVSITILAIVKTHVHERFQKRFRIAFPIELFIVIFGTLISYLSGFRTKFHVDVIGDIPAGLPPPSIPPLFIIKDMLVQTFLISLISFVINYSLADLFARKHRYKINSNQELLAYGCSNIFSSFFPCFCGGASLARSCVQDNAGGRTQMVSIYSSLIVAFVLLFIAPLFKELPQACLSSIIIVALKTLLLQVSQLPFYWKVNKIEFFLFLITFLSTALIDVDFGLAIGVSYSILMHILKSSKPYAAILGNITGTELYKDITLYKDAHELESIKILRIENELHAMNSAAFKKLVYELSGVIPSKFIYMKNKIENKNKQNISKLSIFKSHLTGKKFSSKNKIADKVPETNAKIEINFVESNVDLGQAKSSEENYWTEYERNEHQADNIHAFETESQIGADELERHMEVYAEKKEPKKLTLPELPFKHLIIDCSPIYFIDSVGCKTIKQIVKDFNEIGINVYLADCNDAFKYRFNQIENVTKEKQINFNIIYLTVHDACLKALKINRNICFNKKY